MTNNGRIQILTETGVWKLATDPDNKGKAEHWFDSTRPEAQEAPVPGVIQQVFPAYHGVAWYWHSFRPECACVSGESIRLAFGAVDYLAEVWMNGRYAGSSEGGETPFEFDVTNLIKNDSDNLLAVRVLNPTYDFIDGYTLGQVPHLNKVMIPQAGCTFNFGGIMYPVELRVVPAVYITDLFAHADVQTGIITVATTIRNSTDEAAGATISYSVAVAHATGDLLECAAQTVVCAAGESEHTAAFTVAHPRLWNLDDPFLYRLTVDVCIPGQRPSQKSVRCGFRDFRVSDGYFQLNGRRIFLKSSHTGNIVPIGMKVPVVSDHIRRDIIFAKAAGFNTIRSIGTLWPEQLDFCDEIGLLVIEELMANWLLGAPNSGYSYATQYPDIPYTTKIEERFDHNNIEMIRRDRNHPSVVAWELLNETQDGPIFDNALRFLAKLRALDTTRVVLLSSGRFDGRFTIGSVSNPGSDSWECTWGVEGPDAPQGVMKYPSAEGSGEFHFYPAVPQTVETNAFLRNLGKNTKPVFLSEYGIGSLFDVINEWRHFEQAGARPDLEDMSWLREQSESLYADWQRLGLERAYPFVEDMLRDSQRLNARQRTLGFNLIRSNPQICGFSLTGLLDHGMCGEGLWTFWREWKPQMFDAVCDGWSPLRWCLFAEPMHAYAGRAITIEAVLATEDVLQPGDYPARFRVCSPMGVVWERSATVTIPDPLQLAVPVLRETFRLDGPSGQYTLTANLERGGAPTGNAVTFHVSNPADWPRLSGSATLWGMDARAEQWLTTQGLDCQDFTSTEVSGENLILVGHPQDFDDHDLRNMLMQRMNQGATVLFLNAKLFRDNARALDWLPLEHKGTCTTVRDMLYHKECVANRHPVFDGLQGPGVMDMDYYGQVLPHEVFKDQDTPDETICAGFNTGHISIPRGYGCTLLIALYSVGKGRFILNTPHVLENLDAHPVADRLLLNLIRFGQRR